MTEKTLEIGLRQVQLSAHSITKVHATYFIWILNRYNPSYNLLKVGHTFFVPKLFLNQIHSSPNAVGLFVVLEREGHSIYWFQSQCWQWDTMILIWSNRFRSDFIHLNTDRPCDFAFPVSIKDTILWSQSLKLIKPVGQRISLDFNLFNVKLFSSLWNIFMKYKCGCPGAWQQLGYALWFAHLINAGYPLGQPRREAYSMIYHGMMVMYKKL